MNISGHWKKWLFASDLHGDKQDKQAATAFLDFCKHWKPQIKVFGGDLWDLRPLRKAADAEEKRDSTIKDFQAGSEFIDTYQPQFLLLGNHDNRLWELADKDNGVQSDYALKAIQEIEDAARKMGCRILPYHKRLGVLKIGKLKAMHGFYCGITAARRTALAYGSCVIGHGHGIDHVTIEGHDFRMGRMVGCLASLDMKWSAANVSSLRHQHGFMAGVVNLKTGEFICHQCYKVGRTWNFEIMPI